MINAGAHTIGYARCFTLKQRFFNYKDTGKPDPSLDASLLQHLQKLCPDNSSDTNLAPLDPVTTYTFDSMYYKNLVKNLGLLPTDKALVSDGTTASLVYKYSQWSVLLLQGL